MQSNQSKVIGDQILSKVPLSSRMTLFFVRPFWKDNAYKKKNDIHTPWVKNWAPNPAVHWKKPKYSPKSYILIVGALRAHRKLVIQQHQKWGEPLKVNKQIQYRETYRSWLLHIKKITSHPQEHGQMKAFFLKKSYLNNFRKHYTND